MFHIDKYGSYIDNFLPIKNKYVPAAVVTFNFLETESCAEDKTGAQVTQGTFMWPKTRGDFGIYVGCPYGVVDGLFFIGARRYCKCNNNACLSPYWQQPDTSRCKYRVYDSEIASALSKIYQV